MKVFIGFLLFAYATADIYKWVGLPEQNFKLLDNLLNGEHSAIYLRVKFCWCETSNLRSLFTKAFIGIILACSYFLQTATCCNAKTVYQSGLKIICLVAINGEISLAKSLAFSNTNSAHQSRRVTPQLIPLFFLLISLARTCNFWFNSCSERFLRNFNMLSIE